MDDPVGDDTFDVTLRPRPVKLLKPSEVAPDVGGLLPAESEVRHRYSMHYGFPLATYGRPPLGAVESPPSLTRSAIAFRAKQRCRNDGCPNEFGSRLTCDWPLRAASQRRAAGQLAAHGVRSSDATAAKGRSTRCGPRAPRAAGRRNGAEQQGKRARRRRPRPRLRQARYRRSHRARSRSRCHRPRC
jgi:hypothetical protein